MENLNDESTEFAQRLTRFNLIALQVMEPDDVVLASMTATLNVALEVLPHADVADWLRRLADEIETQDPAAPGLTN